MTIYQTGFEKKNENYEHFAINAKSILTFYKNFKRGTDIQFQSTYGRKERTKETIVNILNI